MRDYWLEHNMCHLSTKNVTLLIYIHVCVCVCVRVCVCVCTISRSSSFLSIVLPANGISVLMTSTILYTGADSTCNSKVIQRIPNSKTLMLQWSWDHTSEFNM